MYTYCMSRKKLRLVLGPIIILATIAVFIWYINGHPEVIDQLSGTSVWLLITLVAIYLGTLLALIAVSQLSLRFFGKSMGPQENFLFNAYSSLINFFGPGQSGPGFRGAYLKIKHGLGIKQYVFITLVYYAFFAIISGMMLLFVSRPWWQSIILVACIALGCAFIIRRFMTKNQQQVGNLKHSRSALIITLLGLATLFQVFCTTLVYFLELRSLDPTVSFTQALAYTGAANFALFVSITPGAIGIREAFLVFTQQLHHIPDSTIVAANVLDRAVYLLYLGLLFIFVLALHAGKKLQVKEVQAAANAKQKS